MPAPTINIFDLWISLRNNVNTQQGGFIKPQTNFIQWVNDISMELFREKIAQWQKNQQITDELIPFLKTVNVTLSPQPGKNYDIAAYPDDYGYFSSARILVNTDTKCGCALSPETIPLVNGKDGKCTTYEDPEYKEIAARNAGADLCELAITNVDNQRWSSACDSSFKRPAYNAPIITQFGGGIKVAPRNLGIIILDYFKAPRKAVFAYTLGAEDNIIYDANASIQLEWPETVKGEFLARLQKRYGMYVREDSVYNWSEQERQINK